MFANFIYIFHRKHIQPSFKVALNLFFIQAHLINLTKLTQTPTVFYNNIKSFQILELTFYTSSLLVTVWVVLLSIIFSFFWL